MTREEFYGYENGRLGVDLYDSSYFNEEERERFDAGISAGRKDPASGWEVMSARRIADLFKSP